MEVAGMEDLKELLAQLRERVDPDCGFESHSGMHGPLEIQMGDVLSRYGEEEPGEEAALLTQLWRCDAELAFRVEDLTTVQNFLADQSRSVVVHLNQVPHPALVEGQLRQQLLPLLCQRWCVVYGMSGDCIQMHVLDAEERDVLPLLSGVQDWEFSVGQSEPVSPLPAFMSPWNDPDSPIRA